MKASENESLQTEPKIAAHGTCPSQKRTDYDTKRHCNGLPGMFFPTGIPQSHVFPLLRFEISGRAEFLRTEFH